MKSIKPLAMAVTLSVAAAAPALAVDLKPTIVLVHGAFADAASWNGVAERLRSKGYMVVGAKSRKTVEIAGASHVVLTSHPAAVARLIETAAKAE